MKAQGILDTNIFIDVGRGYAPALSWLQNNRMIFAVSCFTRIELVIGSRNKAEQDKVTAMLKGYDLVYPDESDAKWAMEQFEAFYLSHQIEFIDCLIAASAVRLQLPIYTRNVKHLGLCQVLSLKFLIDLLLL